ncbi:MAG: glycosyltransferase family 9 protein [bacterium]
MASLPLSASKNDYGLVRFLDHFGGALALLILGFCRRRCSAPPPDVRSILLMKFDGLGDLVLVTGIAEDLRRKYPQASIALLSGPFNYPLASILAAFDRCVCLTLNAPWRTVRELRKLDVDLCIDLGEWSRIEALLTCLSGAKHTIGFRTRGQHRHYAYDRFGDLRFDRHEIENYRSLLRQLEIPAGSPPSLKLALAAGAAAAAPPLAALPDERYAVIHLWSGSAKWAKLKEWSEDRWREVAAWLNARGYAVYVTGGRDDQARISAFKASCTWPARRVESAAGLPFTELLSFLRQASVVVTIDTSISHLAAALGTPVLALHGPTSSKRWGPIGCRAAAIDSTVPGCGYMNWGADSDRERAQLKCMETITMDQVTDRLQAMGL